MATENRRHFLRTGGLGLAALGLGALSLPDDVEPTATAGVADTVHGSGNRTIDARAGEMAIQPATVREEFTPTERNTKGPYHRKSAPYRAKIAPPLESGEVLLVQGRVWGADTRQPLPIAVLDVWHADALGHYDMPDENSPSARRVYRNRGRLVSDETGYYEFETIKPGRYQVDSGRWRPAHIHIAVVANGYEYLITQMYFKGDPYNESDPFIKPSLIVEPVNVRSERGTFQLATFDIVMTPRRDKPV